MVNKRLGHNQASLTWGTHIIGEQPPTMYSNSPFLFLQQAFRYTQENGPIELAIKQRRHALKGAPYIVSKAPVAVRHTKLMPRRVVPDYDGAFRRYEECQKYTRYDPALHFVDQGSYVNTTLQTAN